MIWGIVTFQFEHYHRWPDAPEECQFLRNLHRHMFHVEVWVEQFHNERDIEYITFKNWLTNKVVSPFYMCQSLPEKFGIEETDSCETMAHKIREYILTFQPKLQNRKIKVKVMEDGENGAFLE